jgi:hypothetical protein
LDAKVGDMVIGYASTPTLQVVALGEIAKDTDDKHLYFRKPSNFSPRLITQLSKAMKSCKAWNAWLEADAELSSRLQKMNTKS